MSTAIPMPDRSDLTEAARLISQAETLLASAAAMLGISQVTASARYTSALVLHLSDGSIEATYVSARSPDAVALGAAMETLRARAQAKERELDESVARAAAARGINLGQP